MKRAQIILDDWHYETLKSYSERTGRSMSELVREAVAVYMKKEKKPGRAKTGLRALEGIASVDTDAAENHDHYLYGFPKKKRR